MIAILALSYPRSGSQHTSDDLRTRRGTVTAPTVSIGHSSGSELARGSVVTTTAHTL